jgi:hypothetical protein
MKSDNEMSTSGNNVLNPIILIDESSDNDDDDEIILIEPMAKLKVIVVIDDDMENAVEGMLVSHISYNIILNK